MARGESSRDGAADWQSLPRQAADQSASVEPLDLLKLLADGQVRSVSYVEPSGRRLLVELHGPLTLELDPPGGMARAFTPTDAMQLPAHRLPRSVGGEGRDPVWCIQVC